MLLNQKVGVGRLAKTFLQYHCNIAFGTYRSTNTASFAIVIINLNLILIAILCYGQVGAKQSAEITDTAPLLVYYRYMCSSFHRCSPIAFPYLSLVYLMGLHSA